MNIIDVINKTKRSVPLTQEEISYLVTDYTNGKIPDYQMSAWLMAVCLNGLTDEETFALTMAMRDSGKVLHLDIPLTVDKHSTGGVGDKTSLVIGPIVAACGVCAAKMSGRGLGHTGGTLDKLESISGMRIELEMEEFIKRYKGKGYQFYLLSNCSMQFYQYYQSKSIFQHFKELYTSAKYQKIKPNLDIYQDFLSRYHLKANECLFVDDLKENIDAAIKVGMKGFVYHQNIQEEQYRNILV